VTAAIAIDPRSLRTGPPPLSEQSVHVWLIPADEWTLGVAVLDRDEVARAARLRDPLQQRRFAAVYASVRWILGGYLRTDPDAVRFERAACMRCGQRHGKPALRQTDLLRFNLSRRDGFGLLALATACELGVDIEAAHRARRMHELWPMIASRDEFAHWGRRRSGSRAAADSALRLWTRKESVVKALGVGLALDLTSFSIASEADANGWRSVVGTVDATYVLDLSVAPGYLGAIAVCGEPRSVSLFRLRTASGAR
jgi:4'-phosphopantetheinyl transferase